MKDKKTKNINKNETKKKQRKDNKINCYVQ